MDKIKDLIEITPLCFYAVIETTIKQTRPLSGFTL